jgi:hypothetical protein
MLSLQVVDSLAHKEASAAFRPNVSESHGIGACTPPGLRVVAEPSTCRLSDRGSITLYAMLARPLLCIRFRFERQRFATGNWIFGFSPLFCDRIPFPT